MWCGWMEGQSEMFFFCKRDQSRKLKTILCTARLPRRGLQIFAILGNYKKHQGILTGVIAEGSAMLFPRILSNLPLILSAQ